MQDIRTSAPNRPLRTEYQLLSEYRSELMGLAMLWIMLFHAYAFHFNQAFLDLIKYSGFLGVDLFILLSGLGLGKSLFSRETTPLAPYYLKRFVRIMPAYWLVVGLYSLYLLLRGAISLATLGWNLSLLYYWFHIPGSFNWYVSALLAFYLIAPFYTRFLRNRKRKEWITAFTFVFSYLLYRGAILLGVDYLQDFIFRIPPFAIGILVGYYICSEKHLSLRHCVLMAALAVGGVILAILLYKRVFYISPCYIFSIFILQICILLAALFKFLRSRWICRCLSELGKCSLEIYLFNVIVTREFSTRPSVMGLSNKRLALCYLILYSVNIGAAIALHSVLLPFQRRLDALLQKNFKIDKKGSLS